MQGQALKLPHGRHVTRAALAFLIIALSCLVSGNMGRGQAASPAIVVSTTKAVPLQLITINGSGFGAKETVHFYWNGSLLPSDITADGNGNFSKAQMHVPSKTASGYSTLQAAGAASGLRVSRTIQIPPPAVTVTPSNLGSRRSFDITISGFGANEVVGLYWDKKDQILTGTTNDFGGMGRSGVAVPASASVGYHVLRVLGGLSLRAVDITLNVGAASGNPAPTATKATAPPPATSVPPTAVPPAATNTPITAVGGAMSSGTYHFTGSLVASAGAQVSHVDGILLLKVGPDCSLAGTMLRQSSGAMLPIAGSGAHGLTLAFDADGLHLNGASTAVSANRVSGLFTNGSGGTMGFWVATLITPNQVDTRYAFTASISSGPDAGMAYRGTLELYGDTYGGLVGFLTLDSGSEYRVTGNSVNGNVNMSVVVRAGTPFFATGTEVGGNLRGSVYGPLSGDQGTWTATR